MPQVCGGNMDTWLSEVYGVGIPCLRMFNLCIVITVANVYSLAYFFVYRYFQNCPL